MFLFNVIILFQLRAHFKKPALMDNTDKYIHLRERSRASIARREEYVVFEWPVLPQN